jgi:hypothetical protein
MPQAAPFGFVGPSYTAISPVIDDELAMNCYVEVSGSENAATPKALLQTPGRKIFAQLPEGAVPGGFTVNGRTFFAASFLWELDASGAMINRGSLGAPPSLITKITANETQLVVSNNGNLFVLTLSTNVFVAVNMAQFNGPVLTIDFCDGYILATLQGSHTFQQSNLEDATTWNGLNIATLSYFPDNIVSMISDHRQIQFASAKKSVWYYNGGAGFPVFIPIQGAFAEVGSGATFAMVQADEVVFWLSQDERGALVAMFANGYNGQRVSTHAIELAWQRFAVYDDAVGWTYQENGHTFWVIDFPTANQSWVYDITAQLWHQRGFWVEANGTYIMDRAICHTYNFGKHLVGDWASGNIYDLSSKYLTDFGNTIRGWRRTPTTGKANKWIYYEQIEFVLGTGLAPGVPLLDGDGNPRPPQLMLRWSNDSGQTWSKTYFLSVGMQGQYGKRVIKRMLGRARKRVWEVTWSDPYPWYFTNAFFEATVQKN